MDDGTRRRGRVFALKAVGALMALAAPVVCVVETQIPRHDVSPAGAVLVLVGLLLFGLGRLAEGLSS